MKENDHTIAVLYIYIYIYIYMDVSIAMSFVIKLQQAVCLFCFSSGCHCKYCIELCYKDPMKSDLDYTYSIFFS